jgi:hypothetical protein
MTNASRSGTRRGRFKWSTFETIESPRYGPHKAANGTSSLSLIWLFLQERSLVVTTSHPRLIASSQAGAGSASTASHTSDDGDVDQDDTDESRTATFEEAEETAWEQIRTHLAEMPPYEFQDLVAALLKAMGYHVLWVAPPGPDRGIDMIAHTDPLGTTSPRIKVQLKRTPGEQDVRAGDPVVHGGDR